MPRAEETEPVHRLLNNVVEMQILLETYPHKTTAPLTASLNNVVETQI